ncbi:DNA-binding protein [Geobacter sp. DSM 9736]|uniref:DNA-binding protein n=1 Tax=Geobacter sp. DSM 9736 TaxID=1277350 RepID=UPI000B513EA8|nr:DNA-binding protein [Geobacter sp. DSM 9736]SNB47960.1 hypothetical protein SAMN06269301_3454 [Geobacter sp. DSM 9736]
MHRHLLTAAAVCGVIAGTGLDASANPGMAMQAFTSAKAAPAPGAKEASPIKGKVLQTLESGGYTYVLLKKEDGQKVWLAVPQTQIMVGQEMTFRPGMEMAGFESKSLKRTFDKIIFSEGPVTPAKGSGKESKENRKSPGSKGASAKADEKIVVEKAAGADGYRIADVYKLKGKLDKKKISVRGKVIKVSSNIMSKNWIHLQDGSGTSKKGNNNLVVTSQSVPVVGEVVTATGILYKDKDFGGGYKYGVIMEKAEIVVE